MYYIWFDESDKEGEFYSNFYGGILIKSEHLEKVLQMMKCIVEEVGLSGEEVKWQKVNQYTFDKYIRLVDFVFELLENGFAKIRIFFRNNQFIPTGLTKEQKRNEFSLLYYQFIKHSFGLQYSNPTKRPVKLKLFIDDIPLKGEDKRIFESFLYKLNTDDVFNKGNIILAKGDIREVDSKKHLPLQLMDLILGAICFRLNDKHKIKDPETNRRGKRTKLKEQLYKHINSRIRKIKPGFNIGESTATILPSDKWEYPYMHWSFKPSNNIRDFTKSKGYKNSPHTSTE